MCKHRKNIASTFNFSSNKHIWKIFKRKRIKLFKSTYTLHFNYGLDENKLNLTLIKINKISQIPKEHRHIFNEKII